jgi:hypothetical protein
MNMDANTVIKINDLPQLATELTPEQMQVVVGALCFECQKIPVTTYSGSDVVEDEPWEICIEIPSEECQSPFPGHR